MPQTPSHLFLSTRPSQGLPRPSLRPPSNDLGGSRPFSLPHPPTFRTLTPFSLSFAPSLTQTRPGRHTHMLSSTSTHSRLSESSHQTPVSPLALSLSLFQSCLVTPPHCIATHAPFLPLSSLLLVNLLPCSDSPSLLSPLMPLSWVIF